MTRKEIIDKVRHVLQNLDNLAEVWGDKGVFRRCRDELRAIVNTPCTHESETYRFWSVGNPNEDPECEGVAVCNDCGRERDLGVG